MKNRWSNIIGTRQFLKSQYWIMMLTVFVISTEWDRKGREGMGTGTGT